VPVDGAQQHLTSLQNQGKSAIIVGTEQRVIGIVAVADTVRANSKETVEKLHHQGIAPVTMLTGDTSAAAAAVAEQLGIDECRSELLPEDKVTAVRELSQLYGRVAMVGDGVNDAPALAASRVGIAMGAAGSDVALETADIALMSDDLSKVPFTIGLGRATNATVRQNIIFALAVKAVFLALTVPGFTTLWLAVVADMGASLIVVANGLRLLRYRS
jgi:Cd2+/Zn2+-exporting ATPase